MHRVDTEKTFVTGSKLILSDVLALMGTVIHRKPCLWSFLIAVANKFVFTGRCGNVQKKFHKT